MMIRWETAEAVGGRLTVVLSLLGGNTYFIFPLFSVPIISTPLPCKYEGGNKPNQNKNPNLLYCSPSSRETIPPLLKSLDFLGGFAVY